MSRHFLAWASVYCFAFIGSHPAHAELLGYWPGDASGGVGTELVNLQGNSDLDGELFGATFTDDGKGHTGQLGDFAVSFAGQDDDYVVIPATEETFEEITITAWVNGAQTDAWAGLVISRAGGQPLGLDFHAFDGQLTYIWNDDSAETWGFVSDVDVPEDEWTFVALSINEDGATLAAGTKDGELFSAVNDIPHFPQDNFTEWRWAEDDGFGGVRNFAGLMDDVSIWNEALSLDDLEALHRGDATPLTLRGNGVTGDFNGNGLLDGDDIDDLSRQSAGQTNPIKYDLDGDARVNDADLKVWIRDLFDSWVGDADLDGLFNSGDLVVVLASGVYEADVDSAWSTGDFNGDGRTGTSDLVAALSDGGYEQGERPVPAAVPEPTSLSLMLLGFLCLRSRFVVPPRRCK